MIDHEASQRLAAGRALGTLDPEESAALDAHLATCVICVDEGGRLSATADALLFAAPPLKPPAGLRASVLAAIHAEAEAERQGTVPVSEAAAEGSTTAPVAPPPQAIVDPTARPRPSRWFGPRWIGVGLAAVLVVALVGLGLRSASLQSRLDAGAAAVAADRARLAAQDAVIALALDPHHVSAALTPEALAPGAAAQVVYRPGANDAYLVATGLPQTPPGQQYQLWYADATGTHPLGTFAFDGTGSFVAPFGVDLSGKTAAMVTLEQEGGATGSPGPQVVFGELPHT